MTNQDETTRVARRRWSAALVALIAAAVAVACSGNRIDEEPVIRQGEEIPPAGDTVRARDGDDGASGERAAAMAECSGAVCDALARGEVALGMTEAQVRAATRTTPGAWETRRAGEAVVMLPSRPARLPEDASGSVAWVQLRDGEVVRYAYSEHQGVRLVASPEDTTLEGRAEARGRALLAEGDELAARGDLDRALNRYDRADVLLPSNPMVTYRIATVLDKQLRPIQALVQYRLFLHQLELERIEALGDAAAKIAEARARAIDRILILEKRSGG